MTKRKPEDEQIWLALQIIATHSAEDFANLRIDILQQNHGLNLAEFKKWMYEMSYDDMRKWAVAVLYDRLT